MAIMRICKKYANPVRTVLRFLNCGKHSKNNNFLKTHPLGKYYHQAAEARAMQNFLTGANYANCE